MPLQPGEDFLFPKSHWRPPSVGCFLESAETGGRSSLGRPGGRAKGPWLEQELAYGPSLRSREKVTQELTRKHLCYLKSVASCAARSPIHASFSQRKHFGFLPFAQDFGLSKEGFDKFGGTKSFCGSVACPCTGLPSRNAAVPV